MPDIPLVDQKKNFAGGSERRYLPRWVISNRVLFRQDGHPDYQECLSRDVSGDGACLVTTEALVPSHKLTLLLFLNDQVAVEVRSSILWRTTDANQFILGVRFENIASKVQEMILQYAFECKKEILTKNWFEGW